MHSIGHSIARNVCNRCRLLRFHLHCSCVKFHHMSFLKKASSRWLFLSGKQTYATLRIPSIYQYNSFILTQYVTTFKPNTSFFSLSFPYLDPLIDIDVVDLRTHKQDIHVKIQPEHQKHNGRQTSVTGKSMKIIYVNGYAL